MANSFHKQVFTLFSGSFLAQLISIVFLPILSRLYLPEDFGVFGAFVAAVAVMVVMISGGYELCIMLPSKEREAEILMKVSMWTTHFLSLGLLLLLTIAGNILMDLSDLEELKGWHLLLPVSIWAEGLIQTLGFRLNRMQAYRALSVSKVIRSSLTAGISFILALYGRGFEGLLIGFLIGQAAACLYSYGYYRLKNKGNTENIRRKELWETAKAYGDFPRYSVLSAWMNTASKHLPFFLLPQAFGNSVTGWFSKADRILNLPAVLFSMSIGKVYFEKASRASEQDPEELARLTWRTFLMLLALAIPFLVIVMIWGPELFSWVLGDAWYNAGEYARALMPWMFMVFIASPLSYLIDIKRKLRIFLYFNIALFVVRLLALLLGLSWGEPLAAIWAFGLSGAAMVLIQLIYVLYLGVRRQI